VPKPTRNRLLVVRKYQRVFVDERYSDDLPVTVPAGPCGYGLQETNARAARVTATARSFRLRITPPR
jgi:hypothetical protein